MEYRFSSTKPSTGFGNNESEKEKGGWKRNSKAVKLSREPQSIAARQRRHRISERLKVLQSLVPGGSKMDIASMLDETIHYVKFLKTLIWLHHQHQTTLMLTFPDHPPPLFASSSYSHTDLVPHQSQAPVSSPPLPPLPPDSCLLPQLTIPFDYEPPTINY